MMNIREIENTLTAMATLLRIGEITDWADALEAFRHEISVDPIGASARILAMYGGMGSLNDLILYKDGQPLVNENNELDALRTKLHELCHG